MKFSEESRNKARENTKLKRLATIEVSDELASRIELANEYVRTVRTLCGLWLSAEVSLGRIWSWIAVLHFEGTMR